MPGYTPDHEQRIIFPSVDEFLRQPGARIDIQSPHALMPPSQGSSRELLPWDMQQLAGKSPYEQRTSPKRWTKAYVAGGLAIAAFTVWQVSGGESDRAVSQGSQSINSTNENGNAISGIDTPNNGTKSPEEYVAKGISWVPVATVEVNGYTPTTWNFPEYDVTNPEAIVARVEGKLVIEAKIGPEAFSVDEKTTKASGVYTLDVDPTKITYRTNVDELQSGTSPIETEVILQSMLEQYPTATLDDAKAVVSEIREQLAVVDTYNLANLKSISVDGYGSGIATSAVSVLNTALQNDVTTQEIDPTKQVFFKFGDTEGLTMQLDIKPVTDTNEVTFQDENFKANIIAYAANGEQLTRKETSS